MTALRYALATLALVLASGCIFINGGSADAGVIIISPPGGGDGHGGGGDPPNGTDILWVVRVERSTANLADALGGAALSSAYLAEVERGLTVRNVVIATHNGRLIWAGGKTIASSIGPEQALREAAESPPAAASCPTTPLLQMGASISSLALWRSSGDYSTSVQPFAAAPLGLVVVMVDGGPRPVGPGDSACAWHGDTPDSALAGSDPAEWLAFGTTSLARAKTRFVFVATAEGLSDDKFRASCRSVDGLPAGAVDAMQASPTPFYDPLTQQMGARAGGIAQRLDLCAVLGTDGAKKVAAAIAP